MGQLFNHEHQACLEIDDWNSSIENDEDISSAFAKSFGLHKEMEPIDFVDGKYLKDVVSYFGRNFNCGVMLDENVVKMILMSAIQVEKGII